MVDAGAVSPEPCGLSSLRGLLTTVQGNSVWEKLKNLEVAAVAENKHPSGRVHIGMVAIGGRNVVREAGVLYPLKGSA